jgi:carboxyl-terminal processing protease
MKRACNYSLPGSALSYAFLLLVLVFSCKQDDPQPLHPDARINDWIFENMEFWYLWNDKLPASPDKNTDPRSFFTSLLSTEDRFSWIQDNYEELLNSLQGISKEAGYEYVLYREGESSNNVVAQVLYVKPSSPAEAAGLKRGDLVTHVNNVQMTVSNYQTVMQQVRENHTLRYKPLVVGEQRFDAEKTISLAAVQYAENPHYMNRIIDVEGRKIGYYVYNFFATGTDGNTNVYDNEMANIFAAFKSGGITDLVLDLRFNSGGSEDAANSLASFIGKGIDNTKVFARKAYNAQVQKEIVDDPRYGPDFLIARFGNKASNIGNQLTGGRVYILTSSRTASASELIINALKPFMDVFLIGDVTYGKNVGSVSLYEKDNPDNTWGMQPIVVKVYNSLDQSDYGNGFTPNVLNEDNNLFIYPLGDTREALLSHAIGQITGTATIGRIPSTGTRKIIGHSLDGKRRSFNLVIEGMER